MCSPCMKISPVIQQDQSVWSAFVRPSGTWLRPGTKGRTKTGTMHSKFQLRDLTKYFEFNETTNNYLQKKQKTKEEEEEEKKRDQTC